jgi:peptidyl-prolyl cis-trans isomerase SurA
MSRRNVYRTAAFRSGLCAALLFTAPVFGADLDRVLAVVNNDVITQGEFETQLRIVSSELRARGRAAPPAEALRQQLLERMILERLQIQLATRLGVKISDAAVDDAVRGVAQQNRMTPEQFQQALARDGISNNAFRENLRQQIMIRRMLDREVLGRTSVSEDEIAVFLATEGKAQAEGREYRLSHILIRVPENARAVEIDKARARAERVAGEVRGGMDFAQAALRFSEAPDAIEGGSLGWKKAGQLPSLFSDLLAGLAPGQTTDVLQSPNGFHILRLDEVRGGVGGDGRVTQTQVRHILVKIGDLISPAEAERRLSVLRERVVHGEDFAALARVHSDDTGSSRAGGDLGWLNPGDTARAFEEAYARLAEGQVSEPVRTSFGVHLIQVTGRREQAVGPEAQRVIAREQIQRRKADERLELFLRQLRDESYVEIKSHS